MTTITTKFIVGDYVSWKNPIHGSALWRIVQIWDDPYVPRLLLTDVMGRSGSCHTALQMDCTPVEETGL